VRTARDYRLRAIDRELKSRFDLRLDGLIQVLEQKCPGFDPKLLGELCNRGIDVDRAFDLEKTLDHLTAAIDRLKCVTKSDPQLKHVQDNLEYQRNTIVESLGEADLPP
jgi:hypothetical protein